MKHTPRTPSMMKRLFGHIPPGVVRRVALYGLVLNALWEFGHGGLFYDMWEEVGWAAGLFHITLAILGDVVIVLAVMARARYTAGAVHVAPPNGRGWMALLGFGLMAAIALEWIARRLDWWSYNDLMPTVAVLGEAVGLSPVAQISLLPALSVYLGTRLVTRKVSKQ